MRRTDGERTGAGSPGGRRHLHVPGLLWWSLRAHWALGLALFAATAGGFRYAVLGPAAALAFGTILDRSATRRPAWHVLTTPLVLAFAGLAAADLFLWSRDLLVSLSFLILGIQSVKFLLPKRARDGWQLCAISYLEFLAAAASTSSIRFALFAGLFIGLSAGAMQALRIEEDAEGDERPGARLPSRFFVRLLAGSAGAGILLTALLFVLTPRIGLGGILHRRAAGAGVTGFSDTISLRDVTAVKTDRRVVARVEFPAAGAAPPPGNAYLRGVTYADFDGTRWTRGERSTLPVPRSGFLYLGVPPPAGVSPATADITLEPMDHAALFVYGTPILIEGELGPLRTDGEGSYALADPGHLAVRYRVRYVTGPGPRAAEGMGSRPRAVTEPFLGRYLGLPPGHDGIRDLALRIAPASLPPGERAAALQRFFLTGFRYTLTGAAGSVNDFLFVERAGYCEHFATALCLLLRAADIPARVAAGYLDGEWSGVGRYLIVRQSDAHAWTEAWIDGTWVTLDATPPSDGNSPGRSRTGIFGICLDWATQRWNKYVVNYSLRMQAETLFEGRRRLEGFGPRLFGGREAQGAWRRVAPWLLGFLPLLLLFPAVRALRRRVRRRRRGRPAGADAAAPLPRSYARLLRALARAGYRRSPGTTLERMLRTAAAAHPALSADADRFLVLYHRDRFGPPGPSMDLRAEAAALAGRLRRGVLRPGAS